MAHCGAQAEGSFLSTLTLTDIATGWTECLPLLSKSAEAVLAALQQVRACFPFPILGLDTDNGCEFINAHLLTYCEQEGITFTRGREGLKNDQCFVEQKNGAVVRQVVGYDRLEGERAYRQLAEVYQALRLYVNGFQPSMKLQATQYDGRKIQRVYDAAKTPLQRLLLSHVLPPSKEQELQRAGQVLDPLRLFQHLQDLQQALLSPTTSASANAQGTACGVVLPFCLDRCLAKSGPAEASTMEESRRKRLTHANTLARVFPEQSEQVANCFAPSTRTSDGFPPSVPSRQAIREESGCSFQPGTEETKTSPTPPLDCAHSDRQLPTSRTSVRSTHFQQNPSALTIEQAIVDYVEDQKSHHRRPKTVEWHEHALGLFQHYLLTEHQCLLPGQITPAQVGGWVAFLAQMPTKRGLLRSTSTVESNTRSARAFCQWLVRRRYLHATPFAHLTLPMVATSMRHSLTPEEWERLLLACHSTRKSDVLAEWATTRNLAVLWLLFDTGMRLSELCDLHLSDVEREQGIVPLRRVPVTLRPVCVFLTGLGGA